MKIANRILLLIPLCGLFVWSPGAAHEPAGHEHPAQTGAKATEPIHITMEELHRLGGVPPGWKFTLPAGDPQAGRQVFITMECFSCHAVHGESFPAGKTERRPGPDLTGMGQHHPPEYFAEAILEPNAVIITGPGYTGADGLSIMPSYRDLLTLQQWIDLVAYLESLTPKGGHSSHGH